MAPAKFQIYVDQSMRQDLGAVNRPPPPPPPPPVPHIPASEDQPARYKPENLPPNHRYFFDASQIYPNTGGEFSFEEINYSSWLRRQKQLVERSRFDSIIKENEDIKRDNERLRLQVEALSQQMNMLLQAQKQAQAQIPMDTSPVSLAQQLPKIPDPPSPATARLSVVPQSLQPTQGLDYNDMSVYGAINEAPSVVQDFWKNTLAHDKFTVPIDQSQYIRDNVETSTPASKRSGADDENKRARRFSRPSVGAGSPTLKLSPITETSRDCNSKSSSSSSAMSATPSTAKKTQPLILEPIVIDEPDRPLDPNDSSTYQVLLRGLAEPLDRRAGLYRLNRSVPKIRSGACFQAGADNYLVDKELSQEAKLFTAQLLTDDSNNTSNDSTNDLPIKIVVFRVDQPANEWLYYICNELHRRLVKQKSKPDIELSVMIANPAIIYNDGSILVDEYYRYITLQHLIDACREMNRPFPKSMAAYITLELMQLVRQLHTCDIIHLNINPKNVLITCCPTRDDIINVSERTSVVKLIGFDRAMDTRLLPPGFKFEAKLEDMMCCQMRDDKLWSFEIDWFGALDCIHKMFFLEDMQVSKELDRWTVKKQFKGFPTEVWSCIFDELLNISEMKDAVTTVSQATDELITWVKANISFVLKEADSLDRVYEDFCKANNRSIRT